MLSRRPRTAWMTGLLATAVTAGAMIAAPAQAVGGGAAKDGTYAFTAQLDIGGGHRSCSGALVDRQWVISAASCFATDPAKSFKVSEGAPKWKTTATVGRTNLTGSSGTVANVVELVPYEGRDLVMAKLDKPVTGVTPVALATSAPAKGDRLRVAGYGRTHAVWVPDKLHSTRVTVDSVQGSSLGLTGDDPATAAVCKGDTGGPAFQESDGHPELVAVNSTSWQGGCVGTDPAETRRGAVDSRVDDINAWVQKVSYRTAFPNAPWKYAEHIASGYFTGGSAGGTRHMDMIVRWIDGEVTLYQGADDKDARHPFSAEYRIAAKNSVFKHAKQITGASFGGGSDGLIVRWVDGELTQYTHVDKKGLHGEKKLAPAKNKTWPYAEQITAGKYTANAQRDDLLVTWADGEVSLYTDVNTNALRGEKTLLKPNKTWPHADQITAGEFTGKKTADLLVRWSDGEATIYPGVTTGGFHGETKIRPAKSAWKSATVVNTGAFVANERPNDVLVRWADNRLGLYPGVDAAGTHGEVKLVG
ncbi:trypsin-like serine protease [Streptomyces sp. NPDC093510]|uniref:S1 family peptidase n=1 Tax=Streptomyces sp. NPDC093510 TaxID=3155199 RepID=UPI00341404AD